MLFAIAKSHLFFSLFSLISSLEKSREKIQRKEKSEKRRGKSTKRKSRLCDFSFWWPLRDFAVSHKWEPSAIFRKRNANYLVKLYFRYKQSTLQCFKVYILRLARWVWVRLESKTEKKQYISYCLFSGDPYETRTRVTAVKGRCLDRLTKGPYWIL